MNRWISAVDRIIVLIVGIALLAAGAYAIAWDAGASLIRTWVSRLDREVLFGLPEEPWWHWVLSGTFVLCVFAGFGLLYLNLRRRRTSAVTLRHNESGTDVSVDLGPVADGVAAELAQLDRRAEHQEQSDGRSRTADAVDCRHCRSVDRRRRIHRFGRTHRRRNQAQPRRLNRRSTGSAAPRPGGSQQVSKKHAGTRSPNTRSQANSMDRHRKGAHSPKGMSAFFSAVNQLARQESHLMILATLPAPTVRPPSRIAKRRPSSMATGWISLTDISVLSPGMTISVPSGSVTTPVTSVVRK